MAGTITASAQDIAVFINGKQIVFDVAPTIVDGRTMVPMRKIFEEFGVTVEWVPETQTIKAFKYSDEMTMSINNNTMTKNENIIALDVPPLIIDGRTMVPVRAISEALNANVNWVANSSVITINSRDLSSFTCYDNLGQIIPLSYQEYYSLKDEYGLFDYFPLVNKKIWIRTALFAYVNKEISIVTPFVDEYGTKVDFTKINDNKSYLPVTIKGFGENLLSGENGVKRIIYLILDFNGVTYKMAGDYYYVLETLAPENEKVENNFFLDDIYVSSMDAQCWDKIQSGQIFIGMTKRQFLMINFLPYKVNITNKGDGETEQWVYYRSRAIIDYYYFKDGVLTSYELG